MTLDTRAELASGSDVDVLALDEALECLESLDARPSRVVELFCFDGLTMDAVTALLSNSKRSAESDRVLARAWLWRDVGG